MKGHHLVDLTVSYPDPPSNLQEVSGYEIIDLPYSSKFFVAQYFREFREYPRDHENFIREN